MVVDGSGCPCRGPYSFVINKEVSMQRISLLQVTSFSLNDQNQGHALVSYLTDCLKLQPCWRFSCNSWQVPHHSYFIHSKSILKCLLHARHCARCWRYGKENLCVSSCPPETCIFHHWEFIVDITFPASQNTMPVINLPTENMSYNLIR